MPAPAVVARELHAAPAAAPTATPTATRAPSHPPRPTPVPPDAWQEADDSRRGMRQAFDARYPIYGVAFHVMAEVFERPAADAEVLGYMRRGGTLRATEAVAGTGCEHSWHELSSGGFVCSGRGFALGRAPQTFEPSPAPPLLYDALPYRYAKNAGHDVLQYWRVPDAQEVDTARELLTLARELQPAPSTTAQTDPATGAVATADTGGEAATPSDPDDPEHLETLPDYVRMAMQPGFYVSLDAPDTRAPDDNPAAHGNDDNDDNRADYSRTVRGAYVESKQLSDVTAPRAPGVVLDAQESLPMAFAHGGEARRMRRDAETGAMRIVEPLQRLAHAPLTGQRIEYEGRPYAIARDGQLISERFVRVARATTRPPQVPRGARWIHVKLSEQTLVAYEGERPVFATLVSSGKEGYETPQGLFRIHTKHVTATMDGLAGTDDVYSIEDVPWTMYFHGSYALHAAFWHDRFGRVRSHGCVNLAPEDARWLFGWTTPQLPEGFHGVRALRDNPGTYVLIEE